MFLKKAKVSKIRDGAKEEFNIYFSVDGHKIYTFGNIEFVEISEDVEDANIKRQPHVPYSYWIGRFPITNSQYSLFAKATILEFLIPPGKDLHPVVGVSWEDIQRYLRWLNLKKKGDLPLHCEYQLPSESEWEKAARGIDNHVYPWGNTYISDLCNTEKIIEGSTTLVGTYSPKGDSPYGVADMAGNVWEWTRSLYDGGTDYVLRGGSYFSSSLYVRCDSRRNASSHSSSAYYGFRVAILPLKYTYYAPNR